MSGAPPGRVQAVHGVDKPVMVMRHGETPMHEGAKRHVRAQHPVTHDHAVLVFYTGGRLAFEQQGLWSLQAGDVLLVPPGQPHRVADFRQPEGWGLGFCPSCFLSEGNENLLESFDRVRAGASAVVAIPKERWPFLESLFRELRQEIERGGEGTLVVQKSFLTLILAEVARAAAWHGPTAGGDTVVAEALRFIERHCLESISLKDVAAAVNRTPAHLTTAVRRATGRPVQGWIIAGRMSEARRRLIHTDELVDVIADRVGYADATHFIRLFRRTHGVTPKAWRAKYRQPAAT